MKKVKLIQVAIPTNRAVKPFSGERIYIATWDLIWNEFKLDSAERVDFENKPTRANQETESWEVIFAKMLATDKSIMINEDKSKHIYSSGFFVLKPTKEIIPEYLYYFLRSKSFHTQKDKNCSGATQKAITLGWLENVFIPILSIEEQRIVISKLDRLAELINIKKEIIGKTEELTKSVFLEMFGDPVANEKYWEITSYWNIWKIQWWAAFKSTDFISDWIPVIKIWTINKGFFDDRELAFLPITLISEYKNYLLYSGDILITLTGTIWKDDYWNVFLLDDRYEKYLLNQRVAKLSPNKKILNPYYLLFLFRVPQIKSQIIWGDRWVRQANISNSDILELKFPLPDIDLQNRFSEIVQKNQSIIENQKQALQKLQSLYDRTAQDIFST